MNSEELFEDIDDSISFTQKYLGLSLGKFLVMFLLVTIFGVYLGILLYGVNSIEVLMGLQDYETYLQNETVRLKNENAGLQREFFELKEISAK